MAIRITSCEDCKGCNYHTLKDLPKKYQDADHKREYFCIEANCYMRFLSRCPLSDKPINPLAISFNND